MHDEPDEQVSGDNGSAAGSEPSMRARTRGDTRRRIERVALELFAEQGYEKTSLREIAERVGVTKAALYYHFKSKEAILAGLLQDLIDEIDALTAWAHELPPTIENRREILRRLFDLFGGQFKTLMWFGHEQQAVLHDLPAAEELGHRMERLFILLRDPEAAPTDQLRSALAVFALFAVQFNPPEIGPWLDMSDDERRAVGLEVALDLIEAKKPRPAEPGAEADR